MEETESSESGGLAWTLRGPAAALFPEEGADMSRAVGMHCVCFLACSHFCSSQNCRIIFNFQHLKEASRSSSLTLLLHRVGN